MDCRNHAGTAAVARCTGCAESFCSNCLVDLKGKKYCASCKGMSVTPDAGPIGKCDLAKDALKYALVGIICFPFILGPVAIAKALGAKKEIAANPRLEGAGTANAAFVIGIIETILGVVGLIVQLSTIGRH